jgi:uncharacterized protein
MTRSRGAIMEGFLAGGPLEGVDVVDCHAHLGPALYMQVPDSGPDGFAATLDHLGAATACVSHSVGMVSDWKLGNDLLIQARASHPRRIFGYAFYNPRYPVDMPAELKRCAAAGLAGVKIHPDFHRTPADSPLYDAAYEAASSGNRVMLCHYSAGAGPFAGAGLYANVLRRFPRLTTVMAHSLPDTTAVDTALALFGRKKRVFFCLANAFQPGVIEYACKRLGAERLLYGSDGCWGDMAPRLGLVCCAEISERDKAAILGRNMRALIAPWEAH